MQTEQSQGGNGGHAAAVGGPEPLAVVREPFPIDYQEQEEFELTMRSGFAGAVVVMPEGMNPDDKGELRLDFRIALFVSETDGPVRFVPRGRGMMIVDVREGFRVSDAILTKVVSQAWKEGGGREPGPGEIKVRPP